MTTPPYPTHATAVHPRARVGLRLVVEEQPERWLMEDESVPETPLHDAIIQLVVLILKEWALREKRDALVTSNLGCRWDPADARVGVDPDVVLVEPAPAEGELVTTLRVWEPGHAPPRVALEVVSARSAAKDYLDAPARCARLGVEELWVFDPQRLGPTDTGGPFELQLWRPANEPADEDPGAALERVHAGPTPAFSPALGAWLVTTDGGTRLRVADDAAGERLWPTRAEAEAQRAEAEAQRAEAEAQRADAAEAEIERLKALLDRQR